MRNSNFFKNTKVKAICAVVLFLVFFCAITGVIYAPYKVIYTNENRYDLVFVGASQVRRGISPIIVDKALGTNSCDYSCAGLMSDGKYSLTKAILDGGTVKTVVLDMSYFALTKTYEEYKFDEKILYVPRISGIGNMLDTAARDFSFSDDEYDKLYAEVVYEGLNAWEQIAKGTYFNKYRRRKGYAPNAINDMALTGEEEIKNAYNSEKSKTDFPSYNLEKISNAIDLCRENGVEVILITCPVTQQLMWKQNNFDAFHNEMSAFAEEKDVAYYDFNLLKGFKDHFDDSTCYYDTEHLGNAGAIEFTNILVDVLKAYWDNTDSGYEFYDTYEEAKQNTVYASVLEK